MPRTAALDSEATAGGADGVAPSAQAIVLNAKDDSELLGDDSLTLGAHGAMWIHPHPDFAARCIAPRLTDPHLKGVLPNKRWPPRSTTCAISPPMQI